MFLYSNCRTNNDGIAAKKQYPKFLVIVNRRSVIREPAVKAQQSMRQKREASRHGPQSERESEAARGEGTQNFRYQYLPLTKAHISNNLDFTTKRAVRQSTLRRVYKN